MKKILFITNIGVFGGADYYFIDIIRGMRNRGFDHEVYIVQEDGATGLKVLCDELRKANITYTVTQSCNGSYSQIIKQRCSDIKHRRPDIIHFNQRSPDSNRFEMAAAYRLQIPFIATSHLPTIKSGRTKIGFPKVPSALREWAYPWEADAYIVESDKNLEMLISNQGIRKDKIHIIHYGLEFNKFKGQKRNHEILFTYGIRPEHFVIGSVGNLHLQKAQHIFIMAAAEMVKVGVSKDVRFIICGMGQREHELRNLIKQYQLEDYFKLIGYIDHALIREVLSRFDIFCISSDIEGQPYAILEALLVGIPVVSTAVDGVVDIIENGKNGFLVPKGDHIKMAKKLTELVENDILRERIVSNTESSIDDRYKMSTMLDKTEEIYNKVWQNGTMRMSFKNVRFRCHTGRGIDVLWPVLWPAEKYILKPISKLKHYIRNIRNY